MSMIEEFRAAQNGDRAAFERIWEQYRNRLAGFVKTRLSRDLRRVIEVDDVLQETSVRALDSIGMIQWRGESSLFSWFCGIALNVIRRAATGFMWLSDSPANSGEMAGGDRPSRIARGHERFDRLEMALSKLSHDHRQVIMLARIDGYSVREVAEKMERSPEAVYQLLWRALKRLKEVFGDTESLGLAQRQFTRDLISRGSDDVG